MVSLLEVIGWGGVLAGGFAPVMAYLAVWPPMTAYQIMRCVVVASAVLVVLCFVLAVRAARAGRLPGPALSACAPALAVLGVAAGLVLPRLLVPSFDDVTTSPMAAPSFEHVVMAQGDRPSPFPEGQASVLRRLHPDLVPIGLQLTVPQAVRRIESSLRNRPGWTLVAVEPHRGRIEATVVSSVFHFVHDLVIEVRPSGSTSEVHVRSRARMAPPDGGETAGLVRDVLAEVRNRT